MGQALHGSATTAETVRRAIQARQESVRAAAKRHGISPATVQERRDDFVPDGAAGAASVLKRNSGLNGLS